MMAASIEFFSAGVRTENKAALACVISWADDGAVTVGKHGPSTSFLKQRWFSALAAGNFVATLLLFAKPAAAGCGDYVIFRPLDRGLSPTAALLPAAPSGHVLPDPGPCHGPLCRGNKPVDPVPTPPTPEQIDQRPLAVFPAGMEAESPFLAGSGWPRIDESPLDGFGQSLLRPPCA
jgi:hypothetical protein